MYWCHVWWLREPYHEQRPGIPPVAACHLQPNLPAETWAITRDTSIWPRPIAGGSKHCTFQTFCSKVRELQQQQQNILEPWTIYSIWLLSIILIVCGCCWGLILSYIVMEYLDCSRTIYMCTPLSTKHETNGCSVYWQPNLAVMSLWNNTVAKTF